MILQRHNRGHNIQRLQARFKAFDLAGDDGFGEFGLFPAIGDVAADGLLQIVDVVGEDAVELRHLGGNIAGHGDIDEKHWLILAARKELLAMLLAENGVGRARRGDDNVGLVARVIKILKLNRLPVKSLRQANRPLVGTVRDEDRCATVSHQVARSQLAHLSCAHNENVLALQGAENLFCQFHGNRCDGNGRRAHRSFGAHSLGHGKGASEKLIELPAHRANCSGGSVSFFHLSEDLSFPDHHRIQAGGDTEEMAHRIFVAKLVEVRIEILSLQLKVVVQKAAQIGRSVGGVRNHFHAVARGNDHALFDSRMGREIAAAIRQARFGNGQPFAYLKRSAFVIHANELISHEANLWMVEK